MNYDALYERALQMDRERKEDNVLLNDARIIAFMLDNCDIAVPETSEFFVRPLTGDYENRILRRFWITRKRVFAKTILTPEEAAAKACAAYDGEADFGHTAPNWRNVFALGLGGLRRRIAQRTGPVSVCAGS